MRVTQEGVESRCGRRGRAGDVRLPDGEPAFRTGVPERYVPKLHYQGCIQPSRPVLKNAETWGVSILERFTVALPTRGASLGWDAPGF